MCFKQRKYIANQSRLSELKSVSLMPHQTLLSPEKSLLCYYKCYALAITQWMLKSEEKQEEGGEEIREKQKKNGYGFGRYTQLSYKYL